MVLFAVIHHVRFLHVLFRISKGVTEKKVHSLIHITKKCGPLATKLLQFILMREAIKHDKLNFVFEDCDIHSFDHTKQLYLKEFGKEISEDYIVDEKPIASGSIGQVYKFYSNQVNEYVAVKVKHPFIQKRVNRFIKVIKIVCFLCRPFNRYHNMIIEYIDNINIQLDYNQEAINIRLLKENWKNEDSIIVPSVYSHSNSFIVMSFHDGKNYHDLDKSDKVIASLYLNFIFLTSFLVHDFIHADLHTGNWKIVSSGKDMKIILYDCGIMCKTSNITFNRNLMQHLFSGCFENLLDFLVQQENNISCKTVQDCKDYFERVFPKSNAGARLKLFIERVLDYRLCTHKFSINILNAFALIGEIYEQSSRHFTKCISVDNNTHQIVIYNYIGMLERIGKFKDVCEFLKKWMDTDVINISMYNSWLMDNFGHTKPHILNDIVYKRIFKET
jgi:predicted unusual protein kinase regulating ubiquinone biosynthesis (AarF/ABC1/UbiB family)